MGREPTLGSYRVLLASPHQWAEGGGREVIFFAQLDEMQCDAAQDPLAENVNWR